MDQSDKPASDQPGNREGPDPANRRSDGTFGPGNAANKSGRSKDLHHFRELCRSKSDLAVAKLVDVMLKGRGNPQVRAAEVLLGYAWGKPNQPISDPDGGPLIPASKAAAIEALRAVVPAALAAAAGSALPPATPPAEVEAAPAGSDPAAGPHE